MTGSSASVELESLEYHRESETYRARYDQGTTSTGVAVVAALTKILDVDPDELDPIHRAIDADAFDALVRVRDATNGAVRISFAFEEYAITVSSDGLMSLSPPEHERNDV